ncbi:MAG: aldose 1-epimerase [uncultured bacterium (gcode 4)]|uniref:Aldose 1-epimerase n=1 Tax=uncultured bacterium (gcode 4) TaxID=1234023 RepID=K2FCP9_9BACT|nr:MAG: aldose 1-epimerase [uncultured bacterium (gcode 4)]
MNTFNILDKNISTPMAAPLSDRNLNGHLELILKNGWTSAYVCPEMGGMVTRFQTMVNDEIKEILHFNKSDFENSWRKPKLWIPILMPFAWPDSIVRQHGWAREMPWVWEESTESSIMLSLNSNDIKDEQLLEELKKKFGEWLDFNYKIMISVSEWALKYDINIKNNSDSDMLIAPWLHPYFKVDPKDQSSITSNLPWFDLSNHSWKSGEAMFFKYPQGESAWFNIPGIWKITMDCNPEFDTIVVWSKYNEKWEQEPYICIEPWVGGFGSINDPDRRINVKPLKELHLGVDFILDQ